MSLSKLTKITEEAATFASPIDGSRHVLKFPSARSRSRPTGWAPTS